MRDTVARLIADILAGRLAPRIAAGVTPLLQLQLRVLEPIELPNLQQRVEELEKIRAAEANRRSERQAGDTPRLDLRPAP
jgi:hypothetical protein